MMEAALKDYTFVVSYFGLIKLVGFKVKEVKNTFRYFEELWDTDDLQLDMETHLYAEARYFEYRHEHVRVIYD
jgi:hypothetical protein